MVFYECVITTRNTASFAILTRLVKNVSHKVVSNGGIVRSVQNHGIRDLPYRFKAKYPDGEGNRYYKKGRFFSIFYDASPKTQKEVESILKLDEDNIMLRGTHLNTRNPLLDINIANANKNPYLKQVIEMEQQQATQP
uniref:Ribosomal protein S6 n=1 Tax=Eucampia antarctica TaxID=49252 RepID=A0A7S2S5L1_9STRA|mmetsp:Transcript_30745/g.29619  ORF Transcript_30745/g.29619 Transcript_30745/m.29619 type:complete len:138 (+) Transcript_30745:109-522(+)|eukprot:CAMPEP_0197825426 /NCGR_PEP_ID=MMETSP1437-20131217/2511_1 /TAXON_ID=49252 ORGANISM="Eucampia antarctica, Strain CCMP1452" /NCGR_SAMPLE_ID=MMETSP1437 /ASSEMBLY_ACC=CAM_ASM_001096 /LENGTH=137 /DNA_ID=CAMNT_0043425419 /DNA_START=109 /DNA_END=522 /DNA_ORIENTATION=+